MAANVSEHVVVLDADTCWQLIAGEEVGRLAVSVARHPDIFPVNHLAVGRTIVFRTAEGTKFSALTIDRDVAFEVDGYDAAAGEAWSVVVKGRAEEIATYETPDEAAFALLPWNSSPKSRFVRITPVEISGRRFHVAQRRPTADSA